MAVNNFLKIKCFKIFGYEKMSVTKMFSLTDTFRWKNQKDLGGF